MEGCLCLRMFLFLFLKRHLFEDNTKRAVNDPQAFSSHDFCLPPVGTLLSFCLVYRMPLRAARARSRYTCTLSKLECLKFLQIATAPVAWLFITLLHPGNWWCECHESSISQWWADCEGPRDPDRGVSKMRFNLGRTWRYKWWEKHPGNFERAGV